MKKKLFFLLVKELIKEKKSLEAGFSLIEALVAIITLGIAFGLNLQFLATLQIANIEQKRETAAISASKQLMDEARYLLQSDLDNPFYATKPTTFSDVTQSQTGLSNYELDADVYVCKDVPTIATTNNDQTVNCPGSGSDDIRYVVVQIIYKPTNEKIYTIQSAFTRLQE